MVYKIRCVDDMSEVGTLSLTATAINDGQQNPSIRPDKLFVHMLEFSNAVYSHRIEAYTAFESGPSLIALM